LIEKPDDDTWRALRGAAADASTGRVGAGAAGAPAAVAAGAAGTGAAGAQAQALISMNCWRVPPAMLDFCRVLKPSARGELELPQAIRDAVDAGMRFRVVRSEEGVLDLSGRADIAAVAERLRHVRVEP
jgi:hypothetical protein